MMFTTMAGGVASAAAACVLGAGLARLRRACRRRGRNERRGADHGQAGARSEDADAIAAEATRIAGSRVTYAAATSSSWHALAVHCESAARCDEAIARLRAAGAVYVAVESEGRKARSGS